MIDQEPSLVKAVRTRIAPSPTGEDIHIGNLYTALVNWAFAKKHHGQFIIRIEDTDRERLVEGSEERILTSLKDYGLTFDEGPGKGGPYEPYRQSERLDLYQKYAGQLVEQGDAYYCFCTKEELEKIRQDEESLKIHKKHREYCRTSPEDAKERISLGEKYVVRLKVPESDDITFTDLIRGPITINSNQIDDQILLKSDGFPTYHLAVVVDDHLMEISHVIRAEEWISSTPKHVLLYKALGWELPIFAHLPILRNPDKSKLSKRKNPVWATWYLQEGFLPEAVLNFLALMGWSHPEGKELFSLDEFIEKMDLKDFSPVGPVFDLKKLEWMNGEYIRKMSDEELAKRLSDYLSKHPPVENLLPVVPLVKERMKKLSDFIPLTDFIFEQPEYETSVFTSLKISDIRTVLQKVKDVLESLPKPWAKENFETTFQNIAKDLNLNNTQMFQLIRVAVSGQTVTPPLFESMELIGEDNILHRVENAIKFLEQNKAASPLN